MTGQRSAISAVFGRAASFAAAMLAVLTLVAAGGFHDLLHADEARGASVQSVQAAASPIVAVDDGAAATTPEKSPARHNLPPHGCSGHCTAHAADQAPILVALPAPLLIHAAWPHRARPGVAPARDQRIGPPAPSLRGCAPESALLLTSRGLP